jgi:hypothetical protein
LVRWVLSAWRKNSRTFATALVVLLAFIDDVASQGVPAEWTLNRTPHMVIGGDDPALHRVAGAAVLQDGTIVIGDAGNYRILLFSPSGRLQRQLGSRGQGPGELEGLASVQGAGNQILAYDGGLNRVTQWDSGGDMLETSVLPSYGEARTELLGILPNGTFLLRTLEIAEQTESRLFTQFTSLLAFQPGTRALMLIERRPLAQMYFDLEGQGWTSFSTPFYGSALFAPLAAGIAIIPLDSALVEVRSREGIRIGRIPLPIPRRAFSRDLIERFRDSLLTRSRRDPRMASRTVAIERVYNSLPLRPHVPAVRRMLAIAGQLWVEQYPLPGDTTLRWWVVSPATLRVLAFLDMPPGLRLLGGNEQGLLLLTRDADDVEVVQLRGIDRRGGGR